MRVDRTPEVAGKGSQPDGLPHLPPPLARIVAPAVDQIHKVAVITGQHRGCDVSPAQASATARRRKVMGLNTAAIIGSRPWHGSDIASLTVITKTLQPRWSGSKRHLALEASDTALALDRAPCAS